MRVAEKTNIANSNGVTSSKNMHITIFCQNVNRKYKFRRSNLILIADHAVEGKPSMPCNTVRNIIQRRQKSFAGKTSWALLI